MPEVYSGVDQINVAFYCSSPELVLMWKIYIGALPLQPVTESVGLYKAAFNRPQTPSWKAILRKEALEESDAEAHLAGAGAGRRLGAGSSRIPVWNQ